MTKFVFCFFILFFLPQITLADKQIIIGLSSSISSLDPRIHSSQPHHLFHSNTHDRLFLEVSRGHLPATGIEKILVSKIMRDGDQGYIIQLKKNIFFHDGIELDADDLIFSIDSIKKMSPPRDFMANVEGIVSTEKVDPYTVKILTKYEPPEFLENLGRLFVISKRARFPAEGVLDVNDDYYNPGTGPYKLVGSDKHSFHFERFEKYHSVKPSVKKASIRYFEDNSERLIALKTGEIDLVDKITPFDMGELKREGDFNFSISTSTRVMYLFPDSGRKQTPFARDKKTNEVLASNPFLDLRVRQAVSYAINRDVLTKITLGGAGDPTGQLVSMGTKNYIKSIKADDYSPAKAKKLLAEAGYPNGFKLTLHGPNDRYINDEMVLKAISEMLTNVGIESTAVSMPKKEFFKRAKQHDFSLAFMGWATSKARSTLKNVIHSQNGSKEFGVWNIGGYENSEIDKLIDSIVKTDKASEEYKLIREATSLAISERAILPLYSEKAIWATNKSIAYNGNVFSYTFIKDVSLKSNK